MSYKIAMLLLLLGLIGYLPQSSWAGSAPSRRSLVTQDQDTKSKINGPSSSDNDAEPFKDLDRKFEEENRKINAAIIICRCNGRLGQR
jgi:hypothetical protein